jgi:hypothetical protein
MKGLALAAIALAVTAAPALAQGDTLVTTDSPQAPGTFPQNKQNEPGLALDPSNPTHVAAGANEEIDEPLCDGNSCPFVPGIGNSGIYFSLSSALGFDQPTYAGFSGRVGPPAYPGPIGTVPNYYEAGLQSDGDPTLAFGPRPDSSGHFSWSNGSRLYYSNLTANASTVKREFTFKGFEAIAVSRTDSPATAATGGAAGQAAWSKPVIVSQARQSQTTFSDKPTVWADSAATSSFFGRVYVCYTQFKSQQVNGPAPIAVSHSNDGGKTWSRPTTLTASVNNKNGSGRQGCDVNTDSKGRVYVFWEGTKSGVSQQLMARSDDGGASFEQPRAVASVVDVGEPDPVTGDFVFDGYAGARTDSFPIVDIANGAPSGAGATNRIAISWSDARHGTNHEEALVKYSTDRGNSFSAADSVAAAGDRPDFPSVALSPNGDRASVVYDAFTTPFQTTTASPRPMQGVIRSGPARPGSMWTTLHRGQAGDARGSSANALDSEFIGDYNSIAATNSFAIAVWNDVRAADDCPAIDAYRQALIDGSTATAPAPNACGNRFGNSDIYAAKAGP